MIFLINPPVTKPCEPPAGIARLSGALSMHGIGHHLLDANIEGLLHLLKLPMPPKKTTIDTWTKRAFRHKVRNLSAMRDTGSYRNIDRYNRTVRDIGRVLAVVSPEGTTVGLANYGQDARSPVKSKDLLSAAEQPELNPFYPYFKSRFEGLFSSKEPSTVGISLNFLSQALCAFSIIGFIKREAPKTKVILGGGLVTSWLSSPKWKNPFTELVDDLVAGPGEGRLLGLLGVDDAEGRIPRPDYSALQGNNYLAPGFVLPYSSSSGCYWNGCAFCPEKAEGNPYVPVPPKQAVSDIKILAKETNPSLLHFLDNAISPALLNALAAERLGFPWYGFARIGSPLTDQDFCMKLKRSGCVMLKLGIESGDQRVLDKMNKGVSVEMASAVLRNLKKAEIASYVYLIFGTPAETETGAKKTLDFTVKHSDCIDFLNLALFNMPICSETASEIDTRKFYDGDLSLYTDFDHPQGWDRRRVRMFLENNFKRHGAISDILKKEPSVFTSNHAPFFVLGG